LERILYITSHRSTWRSTLHVTEKVGRLTVSRIRLLIGLYNNSCSQSAYCVDCQLRKQYFMSFFPIYVTYSAVNQVVIRLSLSLFLYFNCEVGLSMYYTQLFIRSTRSLCAAWWQLHQHRLRRRRRSSQKFNWLCIFRVFFFLNFDVKIFEWLFDCIGLYLTIFIDLHCSRSPWYSRKLKTCWAPAWETFKLTFCRLFENGCLGYRFRHDNNKTYKSRPVYLGLHAYLVKNCLLIVEKRHNFVERFNIYRPIGLLVCN